MASPVAQPKVCRVCGVDCAGKPRHKDSKGRYICDPCLKRLKARQARRAKVAPAPAPGEDSSPWGEDVDTSALAAFSESDASSNASGGFCPGCGARLESDAVICTSCGFDRRSGVVPPIKTSKPKKRARSGGGSRTGGFKGPSPGVIALSYLAIVAIGIVLGVKSSDAILLLLDLATGLVVLAFHITVTVIAFQQSGVFMGLIVFIVPFASLWYAFARIGHGLVPAMFGASIAASIATRVALLVVLGPDGM